MRTIKDFIFVSQSIRKQTGLPLQAWGVVLVTEQTPNGEVKDHRIICCNENEPGCGWLYEIAEEAKERYDLALYEAIDPATQEVCQYEGELSKEVTDLFALYRR